MGQLSANQVNVYDSVPQVRNSQPVKGSTEIFKGSAVGMTSGYARQLTNPDLFAGFAEQHVNNTGADGATYVPVIRSGVIQAAISGAAVGDINKAVYMSDGATFTYSSSSAILIGRVIRFVSTGVVMVEFKVDVQAAS